MTPQQARVALGGFVALAIGVTSNALYLQGAIDTSADRRPAPASRSDRPEPPRRPDAPKAQPKAARPADRAEVETAPEEASRGAQTVKVRTVRVATIGEAPAADADTETVRAVEDELNRQGYGPVAADGVMRPPVRAAIMAFEHEHRLALTGEASQELLKQLVLGAPVATGATGTAEVRSPQAQALVRQVQQLLAERGYRPGAADGRLSAETVAAIRSFEADQGLVPRGRISVAVWERLQSGIAGGGRHPAH